MKEIMLKNTAEKLLVTSVLTALLAVTGCKQSADEYYNSDTGASSAEIDEVTPVEPVINEPTPPNDSTTPADPNTSTDPDDPDCHCDGSPKFSFASISIENNPTTEKQYVLRTDTFYETGKEPYATNIALVGETDKELVQKVFDETKTNTISYALAPNFFAKSTPAEMTEFVTASTTEDGMLKFAIQIPGKDGSDNDKSLELGSYFKKHDISGVTKESDKFITELSTFNLNDIAFPEGSECISGYDKSVSFAHFYFDETSVSTEVDVSTWFNKQKEQYSNADVKLVNLNVGANNDIVASYVVVNEIESEDYAAIVNYEGKFYEAGYMSQQLVNAADSKALPTTEAIECNTYNMVAADFLEDKIKESGVTVESLNNQSAIID